MRGPGDLGGDTPRGALHPQVSFLLVHLHTSNACCAPAQGEPRPLKGGLTNAVLGCQFSGSHQTAEEGIRWRIPNSP